MKKITLLFFMAGIALVFFAPAFAQKDTDELWEVHSKATMDGMPLPGMTKKVCVSKGKQTDNMAPMDKNCRTSDHKTVGSKTTFRVTCTGKEPMTGTGERTTGKGSYSGSLKLSSNIDGEQMTMTTEFSGKLIGKCTAK